MITRVIAALIISASVAGTAAAAGGDPAAGQQKSQVCAACHGADGNGENTDFPIIAGQYADYMVRALLDYKSGVRNNAVMKGIASGLSIHSRPHICPQMAWLVEICISDTT